MNDGRTIQTGHPVSNNVEVIPGDTVRFVAPDGRCQFEVRFLDDDGIEVRGVSIYRAGERLVGPSLTIEPRVPNEIHVRSVSYER